MIRSLLFAPANRQDLLKKFPRAGADCNALDLEDGTPAGDKVAVLDAMERHAGRASPRTIPGGIESLEWIR